MAHDRIQMQALVDTVMSRGGETVSFSLRNLHCSMRPLKRGESEGKKYCGGSTLTVTR